MKSASELIEHKRDGGDLTPSEIRAFLKGAVDGSIPEYQVSALLMAIYFQGMTDDELSEFTSAMIESGDRLAIETKLPIVDKHSTGGVGDKVSIPLAPLMAACGLAVPMMSGRGLGHTGGTLDKLESIPGFMTDFTPAEFASIVERTGCIIAGQSDRIVPADRVLYRLRDTTATVASIPLIASSIMSKKLTEGLDALVLDIKVGAGAFMRTDEQARSLARTMIDLGRSHMVDVRALLTNMDQPLGREVGNANEIVESIAVLRGQGPPDLTELVMVIGSEMLDGAGVTDGADQMSAAIRSGTALGRFARMIEAQGGNPRVIEDPDILARGSFDTTVVSPAAGYVTALDAREVGLAAVDLGAGRTTAGASVDPGAGITLLAKAGDSVDIGTPLAVARASSPDGIERAGSRIAGAYTIGAEPIASRQLIMERIA